MKSNPRTNGILEYSPPHSPNLNMFGAEHDFDVDIPELMAARIAGSGFVCLELVPGQVAGIAYVQLKDNVNRAEHDLRSAALDNGGRYSWRWLPTYGSSSRSWFKPVF